MLSKNVLHAIESVIGKAGDKATQLHVPYMDDHETDNAKECIESRHLSAGVWVDKFEREFKKFIGAKHCIATSSGTAALHVLCWESEAIAEIVEVDMPALTFVATANAVAYLENHTIRFKDYGEMASIAVPILGHPVPFRGTEYGIIDAAQSLGSKGYDGKYIGSSGTAAFSFNQNKPITGGAGGCIVTDNADLAARLKHLTTTARIPDRFRVEHDAIAFNYRMSDVTAAILCAQLEKLPLIIKAKRALAHKYQEALSGLGGVTFWEEPKGTESNYWLPSIIFDDHEEQMSSLWALNNAGILARMLPRPLHELPMYSDCQRSSMTKTETLYRHTVCLPGSPHLGFSYV